jgi:hypothetical protein
MFNLECTSSHPKDHSVKLHYNQIKKICFNCYCYHGNCGILKHFYPKFTTTHPKNIPMKLHYNRAKTFFNLSWLPWQRRPHSRVAVKMNNNNK